MISFWLILISICAALTLYAYLGYPAALWLLAHFRRKPPIVRNDPAEWPLISIALPAYNAERTLRPVLEALVAADYPADRRRIVVLSDGSTDGTEALVREFEGRGVELLAFPVRQGKTAVENAACSALTGDIIVNTDASVTVAPDAIKKLIAAFQDPTVGVASSRDISIASVGAEGPSNEGTYVGYEMWVRELETAVESIVGASGSLYAVRSHLHDRPVPTHLSRDFSSALWARLNGLRSVSVSDALCFVPRSASMQIEYRRKIRTMHHGLQTLFYRKQLLNPFRYGVFAWMLWSHKLLRWLVPVAVIIGWGATLALGVNLLFDSTAFVQADGIGLIVVTLMPAALGAIGWWWPRGTQPPQLASTAAYFVSSVLAAIGAWRRTITNERAATWEPTPRALKYEGQPDS